MCGAGATCFAVFVVGAVRRAIQLSRRTKRLNCSPQFFSNLYNMDVEGDPGEHPGKMKLRPVEELLKQRSETQITIEATVDTGFEFMAMDECRMKFGEDFPVLKDRGSILFNIEKTKYPEVSFQTIRFLAYIIFLYNPQIQCHH